MEAIKKYKKTLSELTFNSRPIIDALTKSARDNVEIADQVLETITQRIYQVKPSEKLITLYLLDSICKNVGNPYNVLVGDDMFKLFSHVYVLSDELVRGKLSNLFETWKLTKTRENLPLFPNDQMEKIQVFLAKARGNENERLVKIIDELLPIFDNKLKGKFSDKLKERFQALQQLRSILKSQSLKKDELKTIENQLSNIKQQELGSPLPSKPTIHSPTTAVTATTASVPPSVPTSLPSLPASLPSLPSSLPSIPPSSLPSIPRVLPASESMEVDDTNEYNMNEYNMNDYNNTNNNNNEYNMNSNMNLTPKSPHSALSTTFSKANELFDSLMSVGIITFEQDFKGPRVYDINYPKIINRSTDLMETIKNSQVPRNDYEKLKFNELSKLKTDDFQKFINSSNLSIQCKKLLYDSKNLKCLNCGKRFNNNELDKKKLHLDWHFRINKKFKSGSNVQSRSWYLDNSEWSKFKDENLLEFQVSSQPIFSEPVVEEKIPYVIIPSTETNMNNKCLICREIVKGTFNDDLGEWCWVNCIVPPGETSPRIVHANCYHETKKRSGDELNGIIKREKLAT